MPRKVKEVLTVVDADVPPHEEEEAPVALEVPVVPEAVKPEEETAPQPEEEKEKETLAGFIPEVPWQEVVPKRRGGRPQSKATVDLKAKTRCEGCGRQMCFHTLRFKHKCPNASGAAQSAIEPPVPDSGAGQLSCHPPPPEPVPLVRQQTFTLRDQLMEIQRHQQQRREASHVGPIRQYYAQRA
jgi:hypothetical protein